MGKTRSVHRIVLETFVGPCPPGMQACHFPDRNPHNNAISNLRWDTPKKNYKDRVFHKTIREGEGHPNALLSVKKVRQMRAEHKQGKTGPQLARKYGTSEANVYTVLSRRTWAHVA